MSFVLLLDLGASHRVLPAPLLDAGFASVAMTLLAGTLAARWALGRAGDIKAAPGGR